MFFFRFLRGTCDRAPCLLSHNTTLSKMPTCRFYLQGMCFKSDCPYLHKKVSDKTEICVDFLRGFCEKAEQVWPFVSPWIKQLNICFSKSFFPISWEYFFLNCYFSVRSVMSSCARSYNVKEAVQ